MTCTSLSSGYQDSTLTCEDLFGDERPVPERRVLATLETEAESGALLLQRDGHRRTTELVLLGQLCHRSDRGQRSPSDHGTRPYGPALPEVRQRSDKGQAEVRQSSDRGQIEVTQRSDGGLKGSDSVQTEVSWRSEVVCWPDKGQMEVNRGQTEVSWRLGVNHTKI